MREDIPYIDAGLAHKIAVALRAQTYRADNRQELLDIARTKLAAREKDIRTLRDALKAARPFTISISGLESSATEIIDIALADTEPKEKS